MLTRLFTTLESEMVSVERVKEYTELKNEAPWEIQEKKPKPSWPENGDLVLEGYGTRYRKGLDLVLKDIHCHINPSEKVDNLYFYYCQN